jgi:hypothetical protein
MRVFYNFRFAFVLGLLLILIAAWAQFAGANGGISDKAPPTAETTTGGIPQDWLLLDVHMATGVLCAACHTEIPPEPRPGFASCVACHGTMLGTDSPVPVHGPDPHRSPHLALTETPDCTSCHKVHQPSEASCTMCHRAFDFDFR